MPRRVRITGGVGRLHRAKLYNISGKAPESFMKFKMGPKISLGFQSKNYNYIDKVFKALYRNSDSAVVETMKKVSEMIVRDVKLDLIQGENKAYDTGRLYRSIDYALKNLMSYVLYSSIGSFNVPYSIYVHEGTAKMSPNPFLKRSLDKNHKKIISMFQSAIRKDVSRGLV